MTSCLPTISHTHTLPQSICHVKVGSRETEGGRGGRGDWRAGGMAQSPHPTLVRRVIKQSNRVQTTTVVYVSFTTTPFIFKIEGEVFMFIRSMVMPDVDKWLNRPTTGY